jgi:hypothetical protein
MRSSRREILKLGALGVASAILSRFAGAAPAGTESSELYVTHFYQFGKEAIKKLGGPNGLPNGKRYLHIFSHSAPGLKGKPDTVRAVHALGSSFKYAHPIDIHKYKGWETADDKQLRQWAIEFRAAALDRDGPADLFAFNEMPSDGAAKPEIRDRVASWIRFLHDPGSGPKLRGLFYLTHRNLNVNNWPGESDDFWDAIDQTCDWVVGEHYHDWSFAVDWPLQKRVDHLFAFPQWLIDSGKPSRINIARNKYMVLHSSYYGPHGGNWVGLSNDKFDPAQLKTYFGKLIEATRAHELGRSRIAFGPLVTKDLDLRLLDPLADVLRGDAREAPRRQ